MSGKAKKAKTKTKAKTKPKTKPKRTSGLRPPTSAGTKTKTKAKPAKPKAKPAKKAAKSKPAKKVAKAGVPPPPAKPTTTSKSLVETLGAVTAPSGRLAIFDVGLVGFLAREALEPAMIIADVPRDRALAVTARRVGAGRFADCWDHVAIEIADGEVATSTKLGEAGVDFARLIAIDRAAFDHWQHEDSLDGLADFVFWGRDAGDLARAMRAPVAAEGYGWVDLPIADAEARADDAARIKSENHWLLATDLRPHSHHYRALAVARRDRNSAGEIELAGARALLFFTSWGDGVFPIYLDADADGAPIQLRVQLATAATLAAMHAVNH